MSLFHQMTMWSLRGLALWGAIELGASLYNEALMEWTAWRQISAHQSVMQRLDARAVAAENAARSAQAALTSADSGVWRLPADARGRTPSERAANTLRDALIQLGMQAPVINATEAPLGESRRRVALGTTWREPEAAAPAALAALAARFPQLRVDRLHMARIEGAGLVSVEATFIAVVPVETSR